MLNDFVRDEGALPVPNAKKIIEPLRRLLDRARSEGWHVIYLADTHEPDDKEFGVWGPHAVRGTWGNQVIEELEPAEGEPVIAKRRFSGFYGTDLDLTLREKGVTEVVVTGVLTNICVMYTATDAYQRGYDVTVVSNCVAAVDPEMHRFALRQLKEVVGARIIEV